MKVLITGASGYVGARLSSFLSSKGCSIRTFDKNKSKLFDKKGYETYQGNILVKKDLVKACKNADAIVHLAALSQEKCKENPLLAFQVNGLGTRNALESAKKANVKKFIYLSTFHVYGKAKGRITEDTMPLPLNDYALSKLLGECYCNQFTNGMKCIILRVSNSYGLSLSASSSNLVVNDFCKQCIKENKITLRSKGQQKRDFVVLSDVCNAISIILNTPVEKMKETIFNLGGSNLLSIYELAELVAKIYFKNYNKEIPIDIIKNPKIETPVDFEFDISRLKKLGYIPKANIKQEIKEILEAYKGDIFE